MPVIDFVISGNRNVIKNPKRFLKYTDLTTETEHMWNLKSKVIPVINEATQIMSKTFRKYLNGIPGKQNINELQEAAILGTVHVLQKVLM